ncbi:MAG: DNA polymerase [Candidatus Woesearchaeota archaeon]
MWTSSAVLMPLNHKICTKTKIIIFDIETIKWTEEYALGYYDGKEFQLYEGRDCIKNFLKSFLVHKNRFSIAYAHNGGKFDFNFILRELCRGQFKGKFQISPMRVGSRIIQIKIEDKSKNCWTLRDSIPLLPFSLKELTNNFKVDNKKGEFDHSKITWKNWESLKPDWLPYLVSDCKGLYQVLSTYENYLIENFNVSLHKAITTAQLSMQIFRQSFLKLPIPNYRSREDDIRKAYYGGRTEIFRIRGKDLNYYDVNSLYPFVMRNKPMPVGLPVKNYCMKIEDFGVAYCEITTPENIDIPLLPHRIKGKLIFPKGHFWGWYCTPELQKAQELGYKIKIRYGYVFQQEYIFKKYIDTFYKIKQESQKGSVEYTNSKLLMNALYGKFGQRREKEQIVMFPKSILGLEPIDFFGDTPFYVQKKISEAKHILPAIAAFVTCYARLKLYEYIELVLNKGGTVYYCDTDSIVCNVILDTGKELGQIKDEVPEGIEEAIFLSPKMYGIKTKEGELIKCKGFPKDIFKFSNFVEAYDHNDFSKFRYEKEKFALPFESMRRNKTFVSMLKVSRKVISKYDKRTVLDSLFTSALIINELDPKQQMKLDTEIKNKKVEVFTKK